MTTERFRCSVGALAEPMPGSAAHDRAFLLVEHPSPWGRKALEESRWLPPAVRDDLAARADAAGVRVLLIRRHGGRPSTEGFRVYLGYADPAAPWVATTLFHEPDQLLGVPLDGLDAGPPPGFTPHPDPVLLVCTNGRRDACCAERGRPLAAALHATFPELTWETTHIGGHRFAGAMLVLPSSLSYGRVGPEAGIRIAELALDGRLDTRHLRGRSAYSPAVQAAEITLLDRLGLDAVDALVLEGSEPDGDRTRVRFRDPAGPIHELVVTAVLGDALRQSCADEKTKPATEFHVQ